MKHPVSLALGAIFLGAAALGLTACNQNGPDTPVDPGNTDTPIPIRLPKRIPSMRPTARPRSPS